MSKQRWVKTFDANGNAQHARSFGIYDLLVFWREGQLGWHWRIHRRGEILLSSDDYRGPHEHLTNAKGTAYNRAYDLLWAPAKAKAKGEGNHED